MFQWVRNSPSLAFHHFALSTFLNAFGFLFSGLTSKRLPQLQASHTNMTASKYEGKVRRKLSSDASLSSWRNTFPRIPQPTSSLASTGHKLGRIQDKSLTNRAGVVIALLDNHNSSPMSGHGAAKFRVLEARKKGGWLLGRQQL